MMTTATLAASIWTDWLFEVRFLENAVWQWLALLGALLVAFVVGKVVAFALGRQGERLRQSGRAPAVGTILSGMSRPSVMLALAGGLYLASTFMTLDAVTYGFWLNACRTIAVLAFGWLIFRMVDVLELYLRRWTSRTRTALDDQLVPLLRKTLRVFVVVVAALFIAQNIFHWDVGALIAGLGLGGLAFALAAKDLLSNLFGSITIFADRPFQLGDWVRISGTEGIVEEVGFRSTRIRTFYGELVTMPNATVADSPVQNVSRRPFIRRNLNVTVTYDTPPQKLRRAIGIVREMLDARRDHWAPDRPAKVHFSDFNADSLNLLVVYWFIPPDYWESLAFNHDFNMELLDRFNAEGIEFAFPTQTLYLKQDSPLSADVIVKREPQP